MALPVASTPISIWVYQNTSNSPLMSWRTRVIPEHREPSSENTRPSSETNLHPTARRTRWDLKLLGGEYEAFFQKLLFSLHALSTRVARKCLDANRHFANSTRLKIFAGSLDKWVLQILSRNFDFAVANALRGDSRENIYGRTARRIWFYICSALSRDYYVKCAQNECGSFE